MERDLGLTEVVSVLEPELREPLRQGPAKLKLLMRLFSISLSEIANASGRAISKSQIHRIAHGRPATPFERRAIAVGLSACLRERCADSAYIFDGDQP